MAEPQQGGMTVILNTLRAPEMQGYMRARLADPKKLEAFTEATAAALRSNPSVFVDADKASLYNAILDAANKGIVPDGKQGALAPFNTKVKDGNKEYWVKKIQFMIMPQGIIDAFAKVGITAYAQSVFENDEFDFFSDDTGQHVKHKYNPFHERGARIGAYACGMTRGGKSFVEALGMEDIKKIRSKSRSPDKGPWTEFTDRMEQKSALHRLDKRMPGAGVLGDDDAEAAPVIEGVQEASPAVGGGGQGGDGAAQAQRSVAITDESKRPRGLQTIIDSEPEPQEIARNEPQQGDQVESNNGSPF